MLKTFPFTKRLLGVTSKFKNSFLLFNDFLNPFLHLLFFQIEVKTTCSEYFFIFKKSETILI